MHPLINVNQMLQDLSDSLDNLTSSTEYIAFENRLSDMSALF